MSASVTTDQSTDASAAVGWLRTQLLGSAGRLVLISFLSLYLELTFIRWAPMQVRLLAYFSNYVLIASLLGLGLGMMLAGNRRRLLVAFPPALTAMVVAVLVLERRNFVVPLVTEGQFIWNYLADIKASGLVAYAVLVGFFLAVAGLFALIGQEVGRALQPFASLKAYSLNIFGSVLGVAGFAVLSFLESPPPVWFAVGGGGAARVHLGWVGPADEPAVRGGLAGRHRRDRRLGLRGHRRRSTPLLVALLRDRDHAHPARLASHREQHHREQGQPPASPGPVRPRRHQPVHHRPGPALQPSLHVRGARAGARRRRRDGQRHCRRAPQRALRADRRGRDRSGHRPPGIVGPPGAPVRCRERRRRHRRRPLVPDEERRAVRPDRVRLPRLASPLLAHVERPDGQLRLHTGELPPGSGPAE